MKCSVELPTSYLDKSEMFDFDFVIASTFKEHISYRDYYLHVRTKRYTILDNGAFETGEAMGDEEYFTVAKKLLPDVLILPDVYKGPHESISRSSDFIRYWKNVGGIASVKLMAVLPGTTIREMYTQYGYFKNLGITHFAFPYWPGIDRYQFLLHHPEIENVHILGLPCLTEVFSLNLLSNVDSIDSSLPIRCTKNNTHMKNVLVANNQHGVNPVEDSLDTSLLVTNLHDFKEACVGHSRFWNL